MVSINRRPKSVFTHEGAPAKKISYTEQLRRSVMNCLLWEKEFYEDGQTIADRILELCKKVSEDEVADLAVEARQQMHLRHVPLLLICGLMRHHSTLVEETIERVVTRADQMG